ncbi:hypothetical protein [Marinobacter sp.]|uniref:hypothetical protein n=1 Tax=Marinobacter sp. TaxID=50741 RepID=UPI0035623033
MTILLFLVSRLVASLIGPDHAGRALRRGQRKPHIYNLSKKLAKRNVHFLSKKITQAANSLI